MPKSVYPLFSLEDTLIIARTIWVNNSGNPMRRLSIFHIMDRRPDSGQSRSLITASSSYGLTQGSYIAESLSLTERGRNIVENDDPQAKLDAVLGIKIFQTFFDKYRNSGMPSEVAAKDFLRQQGINEKNLSSCLGILLKNGEQVGLIQEFSGAKRIVSTDHALEKVSKAVATPIPSVPTDKKDHISKEPALELDKSSQALIGNGVRIPSLNINIQIHLPADAKPETYETIFKNIRQYLMDEK